MPTRRSPTKLATAALLLALAGCGSQGAPTTAPPSQNSSQVPGTRPSTPGPTGSPTTPTASPSSVTMSASVGVDGAHADGQSFAIVDQESGDYVVGAGEAGFTMLDIGIHGVGKVWSTKRVTVRRSTAGTVVRYEGPGRLDAKAHLDRLSVFSGMPVDPTRLRLEAVMTPDGLGTADLWLDGRHYQVVGTQPPHTATPVMDIVVRDLLHRDLADLYHYTVRLPGMTKAQFLKDFGTIVTITQLDVHGDTMYRVVNGVAYADAPVHLVATVKGRHMERDGAVELVYRQGEWKFSTIARQVRGD
jgi:hypothetical protein